MKCPFCMEEIQEGAIKCKHCGSMIRAGVTVVSQTKVSPTTKVGTAIFVTLGIFIAMVIAAAIHPLLGFAVFIGTAIWAGVDASKIEIKKYKVGGPVSPASTVIGCLLLWVVVFPWYLVNKGKIARGEAPLKQEVAGHGTKSGATSN